MSGPNGLYGVKFDDGDEDKVVMSHVQKRYKDSRGIKNFVCPVCDHYQVCCSVLQCVALCCSMLQYAAVCCSVLQFVSNDMKFVASKSLNCVAVHRGMLECVAVCCRVRPMKYDESKWTNQSRPNRI